MDERQAVITPEMKAMLLDQRLGFVATVCPDGTPNVSPKGTIMPWRDNQLVFAHLYSPGTVANLRRNSGIEINVVDPFSRKGYRFKGTGQILESGPEYERIIDMYHGDAGHDSLRDADRRVKAIVLVSVQQTGELISPAYDDGSSEEDITGEWRRYWASRHGLSEPV